MDVDTSHYEVRFVYMDGMPSTDRVVTAATLSRAVDAIRLNDHRDEFELGDLTQIVIEYKEA